MAQGQALDLLHGASLVADQRIYAGDMSDVATSNIVVITAGLRRKPDESRLDLINRNVDLFLGILEQMKSAGLKENAYLDRRQQSGRCADVSRGASVSACPGSASSAWARVLDTARFRSNLAKRLKAPATQVNALILGEHGDSMVPIWSSATIAGLPLEQWPGFDANTAKEIFEETKDGRRQVIKLKGGSGFAVGLSIREVVHAIALDQRARAAGQHAASRAVRRARRVPVGADGSRLRRRAQADRAGADAEGTAWAAELGAGACARRSTK